MNLNLIRQGLDKTLPLFHSSTNGPIIQLKKVVKTYKNAAGEFTALKGINTSFHRGEFVGIIGKSGSGKSTLVNMLTGIDHPTEGEVLIDGIAIHHMTESELSLWRGKNLGIVFQFFQLLPMLSVLENTILPMDFCNIYEPRERPKRAMDLLRQLELEEYANHLPSKISGGLQQRAAIARALANDPPIILADEPTGNLESQNAESIFELFEELVGLGKTVIVVTHDATLAQRLDRTVLLADGEIINEFIARVLPNLNHQQMLNATHHLQFKQISPGETIIQQGMPNEIFYIITQGHVQVSLQKPYGQEVILANMDAGHYFGEVELLNGYPSIASVRASFEQPVELAMLDRNTFIGLMDTSHLTRTDLELVAQQRVQSNISTWNRELS